MSMLIHDDIYSWKGWGGKLKLASGKCRLRIFDRTKDKDTELAHLRPIVVVLSDVPGSKMSVRSCVSHIATGVARDFNLDPHRTVWVEHYPATTYGVENENEIPEKFERVDMTWEDDMAIQPKWRPLKPDMEEIVSEMLMETA